MNSLANANREVVFRVCVCVGCVRDASRDQGISRHVFVLLLLLLLLGGARPAEKKNKGSRCSAFGNQYEKHDLLFFVTCSVMVAQSTLEARRKCQKKDS